MHENTILVRPQGSDKRNPAAFAPASFSFSAKRIWLSTSECRGHRGIGPEVHPKLFERWQYGGLAVLVKARPRGSWTVYSSRVCAPTTIACSDRIERPVAALPVDFLQFVHTLFWLGIAQWAVDFGVVSGHVRSPLISC